MLLALCLASSSATSASVSGLVAGAALTWVVKCRRKALLPSTCELAGSARCLGALYGQSPVRALWQVCMENKS